MMSKSRPNDTFSHELELLMELVETLDEGVLVLYENRTPLFSNKRLTDIFGLTDADRGYATPPDLLDRINRTLSRPGHLKNIIDRCITEKKSQKACINLVDGRNIDYKVKLHHLSNQKTVFICIFRASREQSSFCSEHSLFRQVVENLGAGIDRDITDFMTTRIQLQETNEKLQKIIQSSPDSIVITNLEGNITYCNRETAQLFGVNSEEELTGLNVFELIYEGDRAKTIEYMNRVLEKGTIKNIGYRVKIPKNHLIEVEASVSTLNDKDGKPSAFIAISKDVSRRKNAEHLLWMSERKFRNIFHNAHDAIFLVDTEGYHIDCNKRASELTGYTMKESASMHFSEVIAPEYHAESKKILQNLISGAQGGTYEKELITKDGQRIPVELTASTLKNNGGEVIAILSVVRDIRERKNFEKQLIEAKQQAEESDRLKSAFLANMSHEIRTPMNGIVGFSNILKRQDLSPAKRERFINIINNSSEQLLNIINDIIEISKLETGQQKIVGEDFNLNEMLKDTHTLFKSQSREKGLKLLLHQGLLYNSCTIHTDKTKLQQVLYNLIGNALKFTTKGSVEFGYEKTDSRLHFYVKDTGKGIPEEMHDKIFERFMQVYDKESVALGGTGLGLSISKGLVELLGGSLDVQSRTGEGTLFHFDIPYQPANPDNSGKFSATQTG